MRIMFYISPILMKRRYRLLSIIVIIWIVLRLSIHFSTEYIYGTNGAYYLVQARSILETRVLWVPDMPLNFYIQAWIAKLIQILSGWEQSKAIMRWVKICDSILPPLAAIPVFLLIEKLLQTKILQDQQTQTDTNNSYTVSNSAIALGLVGAAIASFGVPTLSMLGDFQKNSLWLVWFALMLYLCYKALHRHTLKQLIIIGIVAWLLAVTHIGVLWVSLVYFWTIILFSLIFAKKIPWRKLSVIGLPLIAVLLLAGYIVALKFDPSRIERLLSVVTNLGNYINFAWLLWWSSGMGGGQMSSYITWWVASIWLIALLITYRQYRKNSITSSKASFLIGVAVATILIGWPWITWDTSQRFLLIAAIPTILLWVYSINHIKPIAVRWILCWLLSVWVLYTTYTQWMTHQTAVWVDTLKEIQQLAHYVDQPSSSIVVTRHGAERRSAWFLKTNIVQTQALTADVRDSYKQVYYLTVNEKMGWVGWRSKWAGGAKWPNWSGYITDMIPPPWMWTWDMPTPPQGSTGSMAGIMGWNSMMKDVFKSPTIPDDVAPLYSWSTTTFALITSAPTDINK